MYILPDLSLLYTNQEDCVNTRDLSADIVTALASYKVEAAVTARDVGPVLTSYSLAIGAGIRAIAVLTRLEADLARLLHVSRVRVSSKLGGVSLEVPNDKRLSVSLHSTMRPVLDHRAALAVSLGVDTSGRPVVGDITKMPHLLVAGTTGSGKSVGVNAMIISLLCKHTPDTLRLILIDPKMLELSVYDGIPHLLRPVITDMSRACDALHWAVTEMERRYTLLTQAKVRDLDGYNKQSAAKLPRIVIIIDELADLMITNKHDVERSIARLCQKARAAGIHLIVATQRPSVDVVTGLIKANIPTRIAYTVSSAIDSRTILGARGGEQLLGQGDMLYKAPGTDALQRVHGAFVTDSMCESIAEHWRLQSTVSEPLVVEAISAPIAVEASARLQQVHDRIQADEDFDWYVLYTVLAIIYIFIIYLI